MRRVVGYIDGRPIWSENTPSYSGSIPIRGSLVVGAPGPVEQARINSRASAKEARERLSTPRQQEPNARPKFGDKSLAGTRVKPPESGCSDQIPEVSPWSLLP